MNKAKRYRKHYHFTVNCGIYKGRLLWSTCDGPTNPKAVKIWYTFYFRNS